jgi:hypothetical protein
MTVPGESAGNEGLPVGVVAAVVIFIIIDTTLDQADATFEWPDSVALSRFRAAVLNVWPYFGPMFVRGVAAAVTSGGCCCGELSTCRKD